MNVGLWLIVAAMLGVAVGATAMYQRLSHERECRPVFVVVDDAGTEWL